MNNQIIGKKLLLIVVALAIGIGIFFRLYKLDNFLFRGDEAETIINSIQIITDGYPNGYYKGHEIFENTPDMRNPNPDAPYLFISDNYYGSKYENNKGWLPYVMIASVFKLFGQNELVARVPFALLGILIIYLVYLVSSQIFSRNIAYLAIIVQALNPISILAERIARYYVLNELLVLILLYFYYQYTQNNKIKYWYFCLASLVLLFHTHIVIAIFSLVFIWACELRRRDWQYKLLWSKYNLIWAGIYVVCTLPWMILVKFWVNFQTHGDFGWHKGLWLLFGVFVVFIYYSFFYKRINKNIAFFSEYVIWFLVIVNLLIPVESALSVKVSIAVVPILVIILIYCLAEIQNIRRYLKKQHWSERFLPLVFFLTFSLFIYFSFDYRGIFWFSLKHDVASKKIISYLLSLPQSDIPIIIDGPGTLYLTYLIYTDKNIYRWDLTNPHWAENLDSFLMIFDKTVNDFNYDFVEDYIKIRPEEADDLIRVVYIVKNEQKKWVRKYCSQIQAEELIEIWDCHKI